MRPDMVLYSECEWIVHFIEFMIPFKDGIQEAVEREKKLKSTEHVAKATILLLLDFVFSKSQEL